mmetsp:Transcript_160652/g.284785  ORF Transcript_160652/g.284785 Transcript_160652/m.284785 type:complete len:170 (+) Transcript_160652:47-556(+)
MTLLATHEKIHQLDDESSSSSLKERLCENFRPEGKEDSSWSSIDSGIRDLLLSERPTESVQSNLIFPKRQQMAARNSRRMREVTRTLTINEPYPRIRQMQFRLAGAFGQQNSQMNQTPADVRDEATTSTGATHRTALAAHVREHLDSSFRTGLAAQEHAHFESSFKFSL